MWLFWLPLLGILWFQMLGLGLLMFAPRWFEAAQQRWPRLVRAIERGQMVVTVLMMLGVVIAVTVMAVWILLGLPGLPARG
jgi:hypothetical protein